MHQLTDDSVNEGNPAWSPDGSKLAVAPGKGIELLRADGTPIRRLTTGPDSMPSWSPDGARIVSVHTDPQGGPTSIIVTLPDGSGRRRSQQTYQASRA